MTENAKLRELVAKGPKYTEPNKISSKATETRLFEPLSLGNHWLKREELAEISGIGNVLGRSKSAISVLDSKHQFEAGSSKCPQKTPHQTTKYHMDGSMRSKRL